MTHTITLASRGSLLARTQAEIVAGLLRDAHDGLVVEIVTVTTRGDADGRPFAAIGGKGLFMAEVERAVVEGRADAAVHSAKDLTAELAAGCVIAAVPARGPAHDVVVASAHEPVLAALPPGALVGTSSMRRRALLAEARGDLEVGELRGNLDTRLAKVAAGDVDAAVLAAAGIARLGRVPDGVRTGPLDPEHWVPAPGQGALAVEARGGDDVVELLRAIDDASTADAVALERAFAATLEGGCSVPLGCYARVDSGRLVATGYLGSPDGANGLRDRISGGRNEAEALGRELAGAILGAGGDDILDDIRHGDGVTPQAP